MIILSDLPSPRRAVASVVSPSHAQRSNPQPPDSLAILISILRGGKLSRRTRRLPDVIPKAQLPLPSPGVPGLHSCEGQPVSGSSLPSAAALLSAWALGPGTSIDGRNAESLGRTRLHCFVATSSHPRRVDLVAADRHLPPPPPCPSHLPYRRRPFTPNRRPFRPRRHGAAKSLHHRRFQQIRCVRRRNFLGRRGRGERAQDGEEEDSESS